MQNIVNPKIDFSELTKIPQLLTILKKEQAQTNPYPTKDEAQIPENPTLIC